MYLRNAAICIADYTFQDTCSLRTNVLPIWFFVVGEVSTDHFAAPLQPGTRSSGS
jgi:hypothetical protein